MLSLWKVCMTSTASWSEESVWSTRLLDLRESLVFVFTWMGIDTMHTQWISPTFSLLLIEQWKLNLSWTCHVHHTHSRFQHECMRTFMSISRITRLTPFETPTPILNLHDLDQKIWTAAVVTVLVTCTSVKKWCETTDNRPAEPAPSSVANRSHLYLCILSHGIHEWTEETVFGSEQYFSLLQFSPGLLPLVLPIMLMKKLCLIYWSFSPHLWLNAEQCLMKLVEAGWQYDITRYLIRKYIQWQLLPRLPLLEWHLGCDETKQTDF